MANNTNAAQGLVPVRYLSGAPWNGAANMYLISSTDATPTYVGDAVRLAGAAATAGTTVNGIDCEGMQTVAQAAAGSTPVGVVIGFLPRQSNLSELYRPSSTAMIALVVDDPNVIFEIQEDSVTSTISSAEVGENADLVVAAGNANTGVSGVMLDSSSHTTSAATCRILRKVPRPDVSMADGGVTDKLYCKWEVIFAEHAYKVAAGV